MASTKTLDPRIHRIPIYEVRLVQSRRPLRLAERCLTDGRHSASALHDLVGLTDREHLACLFLDGALRVTGAHIVAIGGQHAIGAVDVRVLLRAALAACATAFVLGHNHPSGNPTPSHEDVAATASIMRAAEVVGFELVDHVIVTRDPQIYHSMRDEGTLPNMERS